VELVGSRGGRDRIRTNEQTNEQKIKSQTLCVLFLNSFLGCCCSVMTLWPSLWPPLSLSLLFRRCGCLFLSQLSDKIIKIEGPFPAMKMSSCFPPLPVKVITIVGSLEEIGD
jgi:hypothetical protein